MRIVLLIILGAIIVLGIGYFVYQFWKKIHYSIDGPKKMSKVLTRLTDKRTIIIVTNLDSNSTPVKNYLRPCKQITGRDAALFPIDNNDASYFIWKFMKDKYKDDSSTSTYEHFYIKHSVDSKKFVEIYIPYEFVKDYLDYAKEKSKEKNNAENS